MNTLVVKVYFYDGDRRKLEKVTCATRNGVCVREDKQFVARRRIIRFSGLQGVITCKKVEDQLKWLSCLAWQVSDTERKAKKKKRRWKEFHRKRKERALEKKVLSAGRKGICVPPPQEYNPGESSAIRILGSSSDKRALLTALRIAKSSQDGLEINNAISFFTRNRIQQIPEGAYEHCLRLTGLSDELVALFTIDELGCVRPAGLTERDKMFAFQNGLHDGYNRRCTIFADAIKRNLSTLLMV